MNDELYRQVDCVCTSIAGRFFTPIWQVLGRTFTQGVWKCPAFLCFQTILYLLKQQKNKPVFFLLYFGEA